jgi:hypothetical protein
LHLEKKKIQIMEERLRKEAQSDKDEDYMFLMSILASIKELDVIQRLELRMDFLTRKLQILKNLSLPSHSFHTTPLISCHPTPFPHSATHFPHSNISVLPSQMSFILSAHLLLPHFQAQLWKCWKGHPYFRWRKMASLVLLHISILGNISSWNFNRVYLKFVFTFVNL